jgi:7-alpha-hydroxysteroid dehydrogenase
MFRAKDLGAEILGENRISLDGMVAIVTGSGRGIGAGIAEAFAEAGAKLTLVARTAEQIEATAARIKVAGGEAIAVVADVTDFAQLPAVIDRTMAAYGRIDILVNNAGGAHGRPFLQSDAEEMERIFRLEVTAPFELTRLALPHLLESPNASIQNTISVGSIKAPRGFIEHYVVKAALLSLTKCMAADLGPKVRVNAIMPGIVETPALKSVIDSQGPDYRAMITKQVRVRKIAEPIDIGRACVFLASDLGKFTTGSVLDLTGGMVDEISQRHPDL